MSIHGILAALLGSSSLGGFAPLTVTSLFHHWLYGLHDGEVSLRNARGHTLIGVPDEKLGFYNTRLMTILGLNGGIGPTEVAHHTIIGLDGLLVAMTAHHAALVTIEYTGYGARYGASYGG